MNDWELLYLSLGLARAGYTSFLLLQAAYFPKKPKHFEIRQRFIKIMTNHNLPQGVVNGFAVVVCVLMVMSSILLWPLMLIGSMAKEKKAP